MDIKSIIVIIFLFATTLIFAIGNYIIKKMEQKHEIEILKNLMIQSPKKIKAQAKYKKASKIKGNKKRISLIDYVKKIFTLF